MKNIEKAFLFLFLLIFCAPTFAATQQEDLIIPDELDLTKRYILEEVKDIRIELETLRREYQIELNKKQIETIDKALSYSANTVNYFFIILTLAIMSIGLFGWKSIRDVKKSVNSNFEREMKKSIFESQKKLQELENEQIRQSQQMLLNQENITKKQQSAYLWSQFNREESYREQLRLLDEISELNIADEVFSIQKERSNLYIALEMWEKAYTTCEKALESFENETSFMVNKATADLMLGKKEEAITLIHDVITLDPGLKEDLLHNELLKSIKKEISKI